MTSCEEQEDDISKIKRLYKTEIDRIVIEHEKAVEDVRAKYEQDINQLKRKIASTYKNYGEANRYFEKIFKANDEEYEIEMQRNEYNLL